jgi:hypothetical protein
MRLKAALAIAGIFFLNSLNAQIKEGEQMIGGTFSLQTSRTDNEAPFSSISKNTSFSFTPQLGIGIKNKWIVGAGLGYNYFKQRSESGSSFQENVGNSVGVNLFARKFHPFNDRFGIFGQGDIGVAFGKVKTEANPGNDFESKFNTFSIIARPGFYFKPSKRIIIEATFGNLGFSHSVSKPESGSKTITDQFSLTLINSLSLGFQVIL